MGLDSLGVKGIYVWNQTVNIGNETEYLSILPGTEWQYCESVNTGTEMTFEFDLSHLDILYDSFVDDLEFVLRVEAKEFVHNTWQWWPQPIWVTDVDMAKTFQVRTHNGIDSDLAMALPSLDTGRLGNLRISRSILPSRVEQALLMMENARDILHRGSRWNDEVRVNILNHAGVPLTPAAIGLRPRSASTPLDLYSDELSDPPTLTKVDFKEPDGKNVNEYNYRLTFEKATSTSTMAVTNYYWQVVDSAFVYPRLIADVMNGGAFKHWIPDAGVFLERVSSGSVATDTGKLLLGDLSEYAPIWSLDTEYLRSHDRKFIEYGTWANKAPTRYADPITFQADSYGGGVVTFGISQMISQDHAWYNVSISEVYMDYIARANHMNLWGHTPLKDVVTSVTLDYTMEDRLELWNSEGWVDEMYGQALRGEGALGLVGMAAMGPAMLALGMSGAGEGVADYLGSGTQWADGGSERYGNGLFDMFIEKMAVDYDGADWYDANQYPATLDGTGKAIGAIEQQINMLNETMLIRPSLTETSDWDTQENPRFDLVMPGIHWATAPGSIARHQVVRGDEVHLELDWAGLDPNVETIYITARLTLAGRDFWVNSTASSSTTHIDFDLKELDNSDGTPIWFSDNRSLTTVPAVTLWAYRENPTMATDLVTRVRNLLYADIFYLKMEYDRSYINRYFALGRTQQSEANKMKVWMVALGAAMMVTAPVTGGSLAIWGLDMIVSTVTGKSMFDHIIHGAMGVANELTGGQAFDNNFVGNFSMMNLVSQKGLNLILGELLADILSFGIGSIGKSLGRKAGVLAAEKAIQAGVDWTARTFTSKLSGFFAKRSFRGAQWLARNLGTKTARFVMAAVEVAVKKYIDLVGEVIFEFAFDNMLSMDKSQRPGGGAQAFMAVMTLAVLTSAMLKVAGSQWVKSPTSISGHMTNIAIKALQGVSLGLSLGMVIMRIPVTSGVAR